jgi:hypothetical protein
MDSGLRRNDTVGVVRLCLTPQPAFGQFLPRGENDGHVGAARLIVASVVGVRCGHGFRPAPE